MQQQAALTEQRLRIARDVHDITGNALATIAMRADIARTVTDLDPTTDRTLAVITDTARTTLDQLRQLVTALRGTEQATRNSILRQFNPLTAAGIDTTVDITGDPASLDADLGHDIERIVQECVTNVLRHAHAQTVTATLSAGTDPIDLLVTNDGNRASRPTRGNGLTGIRERADAHAGHVDITAAPPHFTVHVTIPRKNTP